MSDLNIIGGLILFLGMILNVIFHEFGHYICLFWLTGEQPTFHPVWH